jgi:serine/threonine-protein kinase PknG
VSTDDPSAGYLAAIVASDPIHAISQLRAAPKQSREVQLRLAATLIETGDLDEANELLVQIEEQDPWEWRVAWHRGLAELSRGAADQARGSFMSVYESVPGEVAPKLALGLACESAGDTAAAARWYEIASRTDPAVTCASFGWARCLAGLGDRAGALAAYERVPDSSSGHLDAQTARVRTLSKATDGHDPKLDELLQAGSILQGLSELDAELRDRLSADVLSAALALSAKGRAFDDGRSQLLGHRLAERDLRLGLEQCYRSLARRTPDRAARIRLVDEANRARPRTWT